MGPNRRYRGTWVALLLLVSAGCVMPDQVSQMQKDLADVRRQVGEVRQSQDESTRRLTELEARRGGDEGITRRLTRSAQRPCLGSSLALRRPSWREVLACGSYYSERLGRRSTPTRFQQGLKSGWPDRAFQSEFPEIEL